jgi:hypothetical protein
MPFIPHTSSLPRCIATNTAVGVALERVQSELVDPKVRDKHQRLAMRGVQPAIFMIFKNNTLPYVIREYENVLPRYRHTRTTSMRK